MLEAAIFFQGFCSIVVSKKQPVGSAHELLAESSETVFDEAHFIVNLHSFLQPLALSRHTFHTFPFQNSFLLLNSEL